MTGKWDAIYGASVAIQAHMWIQEGHGPADDRKIQAIIEEAVAIADHATEMDRLEREEAESPGPIPKAVALLVGVREDIEEMEWDEEAFVSKDALLDTFDHATALMEGEAQIEPGHPICKTSCPCCGAHLEVTHGDDPGEIACVGTPITPPVPIPSAEACEAAIAALIYWRDSNDMHTPDAVDPVIVHLRSLHGGRKEDE